MLDGAMSLPGSRRKINEDEEEEGVAAENQVNHRAVGELVPLNKKQQQR